MENAVHVSKLPSHVVIDILSRLPTKTIIQCRCVCKIWFNLISGSEFVDLHLSRLPTHLIINNLSASTSESSCFYLVEVEDETDRHDLHYVPGMKMELPKSHSGSRGPINSVCHVFTLGTRTWRSIGHAPFLYNCRERGVFLNGNLHWLIDDPDGSEFISCLNVEKEAFQPFPPPPELSKQNLATLNLYEGCLSVCDNTSDFDIMIWVMKEYGVEKSWTKEAVISKYPIDLVGNYYVVHIIKIFKDGVIMLLWRDDWLFCYHPQRKTVEMVGTFGLIETSKKRTCSDVLYHCIEAIDHVSSFLSLKNFGTEIVNII